jgi:hypothetical protein
MKTSKEWDMNADRKSAIIIGVLFIIATAFLFIGEAVYGPVLGSSDYLDRAYPEKTIAIAGMLLEFACVLAIPLIAVFLFPILRRVNEALALGYVGFRFFEAVLFVTVEINKLSLIDVSQGHLLSGQAGSEFFQNMGRSVQAANEWIFSIYVIVFAFGALLLYPVLFQSKLVPRFISAWGVVAAALLLAGSVLIMAGLFAGIPESLLNLVFAAPIAVNEMVLAVWLIAKGFNPAAAAHHGGGRG